jgi:hypothetical protein
MDIDAILESVREFIFLLFEFIFRVIFSEHSEEDVELKVR